MLWVFKMRYLAKKVFKIINFIEVFEVLVNSDAMPMGRGRGVNIIEKGDTDAI